MFKRCGYAGAGVDAVAAEAGMTSGAFYGQFGSKQEAFREVIRTSLEANQPVREAGLGGRTGRTWVRAMLQRYLSDGHREAPAEAGCPIPTLVSELPRLDPAAREAFAEAAGGLIDRLADRLGPDHPHRREASAAALALAVGALSLSRAMGDTARSREVLEAARGYGVDALIPAADADRGGSCA